MTSDISTSDSCRIIVVSQSLQTSRDVANRIKSLSGDSDDVQNSSEIIPWTIRNKYYTAQVHFHPIYLELLPSIELDNVPAVLYTWKENEPYEAHLKLIAEHISEYQPEIVLAIGLTPLSEDASEETFFEHGFEYVDGRDTSSHQAAGAVSISESQDSDIPGLHRAVDALSTIMWPSMTRAGGSGSKTRRPASHLTSSPGGSSDAVDRDYEALVEGALAPGGKSAMQREMEALERWLDDEADAADEMERDTLGYASIEDDALEDEQAGLQAQTPLDDPWLSSGAIPRADNTALTGFEDDFSDFVSAPAPSTDETNARNTSHDPDSDPELPSTADIRAASAGIFGTNGISGSVRTQSGADGTADANDPVFDLERVFSALQSIKADIASMPDERDRRAAAAKAALGLVYGLEGAAGELDFDFDSEGAGEAQSRA